VFFAIETDVLACSTHLSCAELWRGSITSKRVRHRVQCVWAGPGADCKTNPQNSL